MDSKFAVIIAIFFGISVIFVQAEKELSDSRIFSVSGSTQFRRHSRLEIDFTDPIKTDENATNLLKKYLTLKSRQQSEFVETISKRRERNQLPLQTSYLKVLRTNYIATNVYYEGLLFAVKWTAVCFPMSREDPGDPIYLQDEYVPANFPFRFIKANTRYIKIKQDIEMGDMAIRGILTDEGGSKAYNFLISLGSPRMKGIYVRTISSSQGIVTKSIDEVLTFQNITMNITQRGTILVKSVNVSQNTLVMQKMAEVWIAPVVDAIKNRFTTVEVLQQSEVYFRRYIRDILWRVTEEVLFTMNRLNNFQNPDRNKDDDIADDLVTFSGFLCHNFKNLHVAYYDSEPELIRESSCNQYEINHVFYMKFETKATSMSYPQVQYFGWKRDPLNVNHLISDAVPVKELSLKFEIDTDKFGEPLSMTKGYQVNLKLEIDDASSERMIYLKMQEKLEKLITEYYEEKINNLIFRSTTT